MNLLPPLLLSLATLFSQETRAQVPAVPGFFGAPSEAPLAGLPGDASVPGAVGPPLAPAASVFPEIDPGQQPTQSGPAPTPPQPAQPGPSPVPGFAPLGPREALSNQPIPNETVPLPAPSPLPPEPAEHASSWPEVWGFGGLMGTTGNKMAPNGVPYDPLFDMQGQINFGLLPNKKLYVYFDMDFWGQAPGAAVTSPNQGAFDFSKREWDFDVGLAWNYCGSLELRVFGYAYNNLNRGTSLASPIGFNDGGGLENRYYFNNADKYDVGKLSFVSLGYMVPSSSLIGQDGQTFAPGMTARAYLTYDISMLRSYLYFDGQYISDSTFAPRLLEYDAGVAVRPWQALQNLEFRLGGSGVYDIQYRYDRSLGYFGVRFQF